MKNRFILFSCILFLGWSIVSCCQTQQHTCDAKEATNVVLQDYGAEPTVLDIDAYTMANDNFITALWTGTQLQVTLMSIPVGGEIGLEQHPDNDQFLRIEDGQGKVMMGDTEESLTFTQMVKADFAIFIPAGKWHNLINIGDRPLKLYSVYAPAEHPHGAVYKTFEEAEAAEHHH
ncbi:MAG: cupin domain-containing protein [Bacteroidetes bacterium]|nr:cupin domain-containing protein [Bacteroidota bacterium]MCL2303206.1 cupin domain-containing protein [Lentimicrobiaceae bacterium]